MSLQIMAQKISTLKCCLLTGYSEYFYNFTFCGKCISKRLRKVVPYIFIIPRNNKLDKYNTPGMALFCKKKFILWELVEISIYRTIITAFDN
jgi:hypothetical protein